MIFMWQWLVNHKDDIAVVATIASPFVALFIAWITTYKSSQDTKKQINAMKQISLLQLQTTILLIDIEADKALLNRTDKQDEVSLLYSKMNILRNKDNISEDELQNLQLEINKLQKSAAYQNSIHFKLVNNQFAFMRLLNKVAKGK